jgi:Flp pilus assembly protein TadG
MVGSVFWELVSYCGRFAVDRRGGIAPLLAVAAIPMLVGVGAAVDYSRASAAKTAMQAAADAASLAISKAVTQGTTPPNAQSVFNALFSRADVQNVTVSSTTTTSGSTTTASVTAQGTISMEFMRVIGTSQLTIGVSSSSVTVGDDSGCVLALNKSTSSAVSIGGSAQVTSSNCSILSNSSSSSAVDVFGAATVTAESIGAVGGVSASSSSVNLTEGIATHIAAIADPYADVQVPNFSGCAETNLTVKGTTTLDPGVYCGGMSVNAKATLTLNPGVYIIDGGSFTVNGNASVSGTGVTLVFTSSSGANWPTVKINGGATINLTAPIAGSTAGLVIFADRNAPVGTSFTFNGGSSQTLGGAVYVPTGAISYSGGASTSSSCTQIIGDTVSFSGNANVAINCSSYKTRSFGTSNIRLSS